MATKTKSKLNPQQELFCQYYASDREFFGNGVTAYAEAYNISLTDKGKYKVAQAAASRLLSNVMILDRINEIFEARGLNDAFVDKQLELLITQNADFSAKTAAIREYNKLKQRIIDKTDITSKGEKITPIYGGLSVQRHNSDKEDIST